MTSLGPDRLRSLLRRLGSLAASQGQQVHLVLAGGAAIALLGGRERTTKDVDALVLRPADQVFMAGLIAQVARDEELPEDWLNDAMKGFVQGLCRGPTVLVDEGIVVEALAPAQLPAMKLMAWRDDVDIEDSLFLLQFLPRDLEAALDAIAPFLLPGRELKAESALSDLWELANDQPNSDGTGND